MRAKARPSRATLDDAEKALGRTDADYRKMIAGIRKQERALQLKRRDLEERHEDEIAKLETVIAKAREHYSAALEKWRS